jgi:outer membrane protein assembly factor BamB
MSISKKIFATTMVILMILSISAVTVQPVKASLTIGQIGYTDPNTPGFAKLGTLPAGVTPQTTLQTVAYMSLRPDPVGVGQSVLVNVWCSPGMYHAFAMTNYFVDIKAPDGTSTTVGPFNTYVGDATAWFEVVPDQVGTYQFKFHYPGMYIPAGQYWDAPGSETGGYIGPGKYYNLGASIYYTGDETDWQNLTVQQNLVASFPQQPFPTNSYWNRPINPMWRTWGLNIGDYPFNTVYYYPGGRVLYPSNYKFTAYVQAPNSAHVLWKRTLSTTGPAGMLGGYTYDYSLAPSAGTPSIIYAGRCYQSVSKSFDNGTVANVFQCYDLRTGEVYWERQLAVTPNIIEYMAPGINYVVGSTSISRDTLADQGWAINLIAISGGRLYKFSPATGVMNLNVSISPLTSSTYYAPGLALGIQTIGSGASAKYRLINWTTFGTSDNFTSRIASNISYPMSSLGVVDYEAGIGAVCSWANPPGPQWCIGVYIQAADIKTGALLWNYTTNDTLSQNAQSPSSFVMDHGKLAYGGHGRHWVCFDARTGHLLWESEKTEYPWGAWFPYNTASYDINETCGAIITSTYEGVYAINWADGTILWHFGTADFAVPYEGPYDAEPFFTGQISADGKIFAYNGEHTASYPRDRGWSMYAINGTTGELVWKIHNPMTPGAVADGYLTASNSYDGNMYVFGPGKSATTIAVSPEAVAQGSIIHIKGTVMDLSPAQPDTPCVSKDSMTLQMESIHMQMPQAGLWGNETLTGVPVTLTAIAADGTVTDIGTVTTNGYYGTFGSSWTPPSKGEYTIMASFAGDESYGSSSAATTFTVGEAASSTPAPSVTQAPTGYATTSDIATYMIGGVVAIIIAIAIVGALMLRKR